MGSSPFAPTSKIPGQTPYVTGSARDVANESWTVWTVSLDLPVMETTHKPPCRDLGPGVAIVHDSAHRSPQIIRERKADDTGWWLTDGSGIADRVFDKSDEWQLGH